MKTSTKVSLLFCALCVLRGEIYSQRIAFASPTPTGWQLFTTDPDGADTRQLSKGEFDVREPDWFPDRKKIAFTTTDGNAYVVEEKTGMVTDTIASDELYFWQVSVNNNGTLLYLIGGKPENADYTSIFEIDLNDRKMSTVLQLRTPVYHLDISPKNNDILFANTLCGSDCEHVIQEIWIREAAGKTAYQLNLLNSLSRYPRWTPDGTTFWFDSEVNRSYRIFRQERDKRTPEMLFSDAAPDDNYTHPAIAPDGNKFAYIKNNRLFIGTIERPESAVNIHPFPEKPETRIKDIAW